MKILRKKELTRIDQVYKDLERANFKIAELEKQQSEIIGKVFIVTANGKMITGDSIMKSDTDKSKQTKDADSWSNTLGLANKPFDPYAFLLLYDESPTLFRVINQIATDAAGLGYSLTLNEHHKESITEKQRILTLLKNPNGGKSSFRQIMNSLIIDYELVGYQALEVVRGKNNKVTKIFHLPVCDLWVHADGNKFCQKSGTKEVWFSEFSNDVDRLRIKSSNGGIQEDLTLDDIGNEIFFNKMYYPRSKLYGVPPLMSAVGHIASMIGIRDYNLSFFENLGIPAYLVQLTGKWSDDAADDIHKFINTELKGASNANKTLILQSPSGGEATFTPISTQAREGSFRLYLDSLKEDVLSVYSMPPYRIGIAEVGKLSGTTAKELNEIYKNGVIEPVQDELEKMMDAIINSEAYTFKFIDLDTKDKMLELSLETQKLNTGRISINELRRKAGEIELPEKFADYHFVSRSMVPLELLGLVSPSGK